MSSYSNQIHKNGVVVAKRQRGDQSPVDDYEMELNHISIPQDLLFPVLKYRKGFHVDFIIVHHTIALVVDNILYTPKKKHEWQTQTQTTTLISIPPPRLILFYFIIILV